MEAQQSQGYVGIYWVKLDQDGHARVIADKSSLLQAEAYGEFLTHSRGHYDIWEAWRGLSIADFRKLKLPIEIREYEYEELPRGRVVFHKPRKLFIVYADRRLQTAGTISKIKTAFDIHAKNVSVESDTHYTTRPLDD